MANSLNETPTKGTPSPLDKVPPPKKPSKTQEMADQLIENARKLRAERTSQAPKTKPIIQAAQQVRGQTEGVLKNPPPAPAAKPTPPLRPVSETKKPAPQAKHPPTVPVRPPQPSSPNPKQAAQAASRPLLQRRLTDSEAKKRSNKPTPASAPDQLKANAHRALEQSLRVIPNLKELPEEVRIKGERIAQAIKQHLEVKEAQLKNSSELSDGYQKAIAFDKELREILNGQNPKALLTSNLERRVQFFFT